MTHRWLSVPAETPQIAPECVYYNSAQTLRTLFRSYTLYMHARTHAHTHIHGPTHGSFFINDSCGK
jgi:hypothetical protein